MLNLREVEDAKTLMTEAVHWSVMKWLAEKKRVRKAADKANDALDALDMKVKSNWGDELKAAYDALSDSTTETHRKGNGKCIEVSQAVKQLAKSIKQADDEAYRVRMDAEDTFDLAEKRLSTSMAREGTQKAIASWNLHEQAILKSQAAIKTTK